MIHERHKLFIQAISALFHAQQGVNDVFFSRRIGEEISNLLEAHLYCVQPVIDTSDNKQARRAFLQSLKKTETLLEEISYLNKGVAISLAVARERVLFCLQDVLHDARDQRRVRASISVPAASSSPVRDMNSTREKILDFVRSGPERRPKDVIDQFSALSERTVKRNLKELSEEGLIVKKTEKENRATYYSAK